MKRLTTLLTLCLPMAAMADYDEAIDGDLSNDQFTPTVIALETGTNFISAGNTAAPLDRDFFTITIGDNEQISSIELSEYELISNPMDGGSLIALEEGPVITSLEVIDFLRGLVIAGVLPGTTVGEPLLDSLGGAPLPPGTYSFWVQNTGSDTSYTLALTLEQIGPPPPSNSAIGVPTLGWPALVIFSLGLLMLGMRRI